MVPSKKKCVSDACRKNRNLALRSGSLFISTQKVHKPKSQSQLHFEVRKFWQIRSSKYFPIAWHWLPADMLEHWPHVCRSRVKITFTIPLKNRFIFTTTNSMKCLVNWIPLRIWVRLRNTQAHLKRSRFLVVCLTWYLWHVKVYWQFSHGHWQVVSLSQQFLRLLGTKFSGYESLAVNSNIEVSTILYP